jgi:glycosyltransferase involved in cell wall biosynthesis
VNDVDVRSVGHVVWSGRIGGIERLVCDLAAEQLRSGLDVTVTFGQSSGPFVQEIANVGVRISDLGLANGRDLRPGGVRRGAALLREMDVLHLHAFNLPLSLIAVRSGRPLVFTEHGNFGVGRQLRYSDRAKRRLQARFLRRHVNIVGANSNHTADTLCRIYGIDRRKVAVVYNGVPHSGDGLRRHGDGGKDEVHVAFVGRLAEVKRVDRLIGAVARARLRESLDVSIIGGGPLESELRSLVAAHGLERRVCFLGYRSDVASLLTDVDVLVLPSEGDAFGLAIVEACARGALPIVFSDGGGVLETLPPDGIVVEDVEGLAAVLDELFGSPLLSGDARRARARWAAETFPIAKTSEKYLSLYESALAARAR